MQLLPNSEHREGFGEGGTSSKVEVFHSIFEEGDSREGNRVDNRG